MNDVEKLDYLRLIFRGKITTKILLRYVFYKCYFSFFSMRSIEGGLEGPFGGMLIDKYGPRKITIISTIVASLGMIMVLFVRDI